MARTMIAFVFSWVMCAIVNAQEPSFAPHDNQVRATIFHSQSSLCRHNNARFCGPNCAPIRCTESEDPFPGVTELRWRRTQLFQHLAYESPLEASYFYRPYSYMNVLSQQALSQQSSGGDAKNAYDNRGLQAIYKNK